MGLRSPVLREDGEAVSIGRESIAGRTAVHFSPPDEGTAASGRAERILYLRFGMGPLRA